MSLKLKEITLDKNDLCIVNLPDGSNIALTHREKYDNQVELSVYTSTKDGCVRDTPCVHMINSNSLAIELRRIKNVSKK